MTLKIFDARPYINALTNKMNGKGFENKQRYKNCDIEWLDIQNIHHARDAYKKVTNLSLRYQSFFI